MNEMILADANHSLAFLKKQKRQVKKEPWTHVLIERDREVGVAKCVKDINAEISWGYLERYDLPEAACFCAITKKNLHPINGEG